LKSGRLPPRGAAAGTDLPRKCQEDSEMSTVAQIDAAIGSATSTVYEQMKTLLADTTTDAGTKAAQLLDAQAQLSFVQGASHAVGQGYSLTGRIGQ
jgi:hypothetical protein